MTTINFKMDVTFDPDVEIIGREIQSTKVFLMKFMWTFCGSYGFTETCELAEQYISSDEDVETFFCEFFDGNHDPDTIRQCLDNYIAWCYQEATSLYN
jgi:hypothetical protein